MKREHWVYIAIAGIIALILGIAQYFKSETPAHQSKAHMEMMSRKAAEARKKNKEDESSDKQETPKGGDDETKD